MIYRYGDTCVASYVPVGGLCAMADTCQCHGAVEVKVQLAGFGSSRGKWDFQWRAANGVPSVYRRTVDGFFLIGFDTSDTFTVSPNASEVFVALPHIVHEDTIRHLLLDQVLPRVLAHRGRSVLHTSAVTVDHRVIAFLGDTGAGKSTLAAFLHRAGHDILTDDALIVRRSGHGFLAVPTYPSLRLWPDSVAAVFDSPPDVAPMARYSAKCRVEVRDRSEPDYIGKPLAAVYALQPTDKVESIIIHPMTPRDACMSLIRSTFQLDPTDRGRASQLLASVVDIARHIPVFAIAYPRDFGLLPKVRDTILGHKDHWEPSASPAEVV